MAITGRKPTASRLKLVRGNPGKRKTNKAEPRFQLAIPPAPAHLSDEAKIEWGRVAEVLFRAGMLTTVDRAALAAYCEAWGIFEQASTMLREIARQSPSTKGLIVKTLKGNWIQNPILGVANKAREDVMKFCVEFGMSPSARSRIQAIQPSYGHDEKADADTADRFFG